MKKFFKYILIVLIVFSLVGVTKVAFSFQEKIETENVKEIESEDFVKEELEVLNHNKVINANASVFFIKEELFAERFINKRTKKLYLLYQMIRI